MLGSLIKFSFKMLMLFGFFWCAYVVLPEDWQVKVDEWVEVPIHQLRVARYHSYRFACEFFGRTKAEAIQDAEQFNYDINHRTNAIRDQMQNQ